MILILIKPLVKSVPGSKNQTFSSAALLEDHLQVCVGMLAQELKKINFRNNRGRDFARSTGDGLSNPVAKGVQRRGRSGNKWVLRDGLVVEVRIFFNLKGNKFCKD